MAISSDADFSHDRPGSQDLLLNIQNKIKICKNEKNTARIRE